jgi:hypothetical protein
MGVKIYMIIDEKTIICPLVAKYSIVNLHKSTYLGYFRDGYIKKIDTLVGHSLEHYASPLAALKEQIKEYNNDKQVSCKNI